MSKLKADNVENLAGTETTSMNNVIAGCAKAWVNFNGTGVVAIRDSHNVSSITDSGTGLYTVNFAIAFPSANYAWASGSSAAGTDGRFQTENIARTTTAFQLSTQNSAQAVTDSTNVSAIFFG